MSCLVLRDMQKAETTRAEQERWKERKRERHSGRQRQGYKQTEREREREITSYCIGSCYMHWTWHKSTYWTWIKMKMKKLSTLSPQKGNGIKLCMYHSDKCWKEPN